MSVVNNRFPARSIPYIHLHAAASPLQGPARTPPPRDRRGQGLIFHLGTLSPHPGENSAYQHLPIKTPPSYISTDPSMSTGTQAAAHTDLHPPPPRPTHNPPLASDHILPWGVLLVNHYTTPELLKLSVNLKFIFSTRLPGEVPLIMHPLKLLVQLLALQGYLGYLL